MDLFYHVGHFGLVSDLTNQTKIAHSITGDSKKNKKKERAKDTSVKHDDKHCLTPSTYVQKDTVCL